MGSIVDDRICKHTTGDVETDGVVFCKNCSPEQQRLCWPEGSNPDPDDNERFVDESQSEQAWMGAK